MPENFFNAAERMRDSSRLLHNTAHWHNACYMAGYVVECYLKIFLQFGIVTGTPRNYSHDFID
jgi:HEPN domain-containing protein